MKRLLQICAIRVNELGREMDFDEVAKEDVWSLVKFIISEKSSLICDNHLDQLIFCSFFAIGKMAKKENLTFALLFHKYQNLKYADKRFTSLQQQLTYRESDFCHDLIKSLPIVKFYNEFFIKETEWFMVELKSTRNEGKTSGNRIGCANGEISTNSIPCFAELPPPRSRSNSAFTDLLKSPLRESLPLPNFGRNSLTPNRMTINGLNSTMTPTRLREGLGSMPPARGGIFTQEALSRAMNTQGFESRLIGVTGATGVLREAGFAGSQFSLQNRLNGFKPGAGEAIQPDFLRSKRSISFGGDEIEKAGIPRKLVQLNDGKEGSFNCFSGNEKTNESCDEEKPFFPNILE